MKILGIESSCDETGASVVENGNKVLSNVVATSQSMHALTGGIIPEQAARQQIKSIIPVIEQALQDAHVTKDDIDAIAVTVGPGLIGSLLVGVETAKTLSLLWNKPLVPVNHLVGHLYANFLSGQEIKFPAIGLVISGGHTDMVLIKSHQEMEWIGGTRDDAAGEAFDKTARLLDLGYPGGPAIAEAAQKYMSTHKDKLNFFPRPLGNDETFDFSFSGLKTAVLREVKGKELTDEKRHYYAAQIQAAIVDVVVDKTLAAAAKFDVASILLGGGVAANTYLRERFISEKTTKEVLADFHVPDPSLCTDNAAYIVCAAHYHFSPIEWSLINAQPNLSIIPAKI